MTRLDTRLTAACINPVLAEQLIWILFIAFQRCWNPCPVPGKTGQGTHVSQRLSTELDKWEFGEPQASGILSPAYWRGGKFNSPGRTCLGVARRAKTEALG